MQTGLVGLAVWSCFVATAHGAGLMLVPVLMPICLSGTPSQALTVTGSIPVGIAALGVHTGAMLATIGLVSIAVYEWIGLAVLRSHPDQLRSRLDRGVESRWGAVVVGLKRSGARFSFPTSMTWGKPLRSRRSLPTCENLANRAMLERVKSDAEKGDEIFALANAVDPRWTPQRLGAAAIPAADRESPSD
jgi:hypothetical protein